VELTVAMAVMVVVFAAVVPLLRGIHNSWDTRQGTMDLTQNGRILIDHLYKHLAAAKKVTAVSGSGVTSGYIQFRGSDDETYRYDISGTNYVEYGLVGSLGDLAGPVSSLQFTCYDDADLATPITDGNDIRLIKIQTIMTNTTPMGQNQTWKTSVQLRCNVRQDPALVGWWRFNEASGLTALDSSGKKNDGTLKNMTGNERTAGVLNKALAFDGTNDHVELPIGSLIRSLDSITVATWANFSNTGGAWQRLFDFGMSTNVNMFLTPRVGSSGNMRFGITLKGYDYEYRLNAPATLPTGWHHVAVTIDGTTKTMKLYQDGAVLDTQTTAVLPSDLGKTTNNYLGRSQYSADAYYTGKLDDFRIYNYVLTSTQIGDLFAVGDMVQHLPFDESSGTTAHDNAGDNDGSRHGAAWITGTWSGALRFDGDDDYVSAARTIQNDFTLAFWVKTSRSADGGTNWTRGDGLVDAQVDGSRRDFGTAVCDNRVAFGVGGTSSNITILSTSSVTDNEWHHVAAMRNASTGLIQLFFDGALQASKTGPTSSRNAPDGIRIGGSLPGTAGEYFQGLIDDVRIYDRVLTADQIALLLE